MVLGLQASEMLADVYGFERLFFGSEVQSLFLELEVLILIFFLKIYQISP
jgi:hypothetical protein